MAVEQVTDAEFIARLEQNPKVVVKYYADWCGSCRLFAPKFKRISEDERFAGISFLDINAETNPEARRKAGVTTLPFFAVFEKGTLIDTTSASKEEVVVELINKLKQN